MLIHTLLRLSTLSLCVSLVLCTTPHQQSQLSALHDRMNQMLSELYSSPLLSKVKAASTEDVPPASPESTYVYSAPAPRVVYVSPSYPETSTPTEYAYPVANPFPRPAYSFDFYQPQYPVYSAPAPRPYPEYPRAYPQGPPAQPVPFAPFAPPIYTPYSSAPYPRPPFGYQGYPAAGLPPPFLGQVPYPPVSFSGPASQVYGPAFQYPPVSPYSNLPQQFAPLPFSAPAPFPSMPAPYSPSLTYPQPVYSPLFPRPSDLVPQPQYEYGS